MKITRKEFLLLSGLTLAGVAGGKAVRAVSNEPEAPAAKVPAKRWGMVVDLQKCRQDAGCKDCIQACNKAHNIPQISNPNHEVKWVWTEPFEKVFPQAQTDYTRQQYAGVPSRSCATSVRIRRARVCVRPRPPGSARRRHRDDGFPPLHWLPVLHGGMSLWLEKLQLARPATRHCGQSIPISRRAPRV